MDMAEGPESENPMKMKKTKKTVAKKSDKKVLEKTEKKTVAKKSVVAKKPAKTTATKGDKAQVGELLKKLEKADASKAKNIRRQLRKLGHTGGLRKE